MPFGAGSLYSANRPAWRNGSSTASAICSIWSSRPPMSLVGDVGHLLEHQLLDLGPGSFSSSTRTAVSMSTVSPAAQVLAAQGVGQLAHALLVGPADDQRHAPSIRLLDGDDLAGDLLAAGP
jgi:hypothetical protein